MQKKIDRYYELKRKLQEADYISSKLAEAVAEYIVMDNGDKSKLVSIYNEYLEVIKNKQSWRDEINELEKQLKELNYGA